MTRRGKDGHVGADLRKDHCGGGIAQAGHGDQEADRGAKGRKRLGDVSLQVRYRCLKRLNLRQMQLEHEAMMGGHPAAQHVDQLRARGLQSAFRQVGQPLGIRFADDQRFQNGAPVPPNGISPIPLAKIETASRCERIMLKRSADHFRRRIVQSIDFGEGEPRRPIAERS